MPKPHEVRSRVPPTTAPKSDIVQFEDSAPFPYRGVNPYSKRPFMDVKSETAASAIPRAAASCGRIAPSPTAAC